ncbi:hypothetical protein JRI60_35300 [Archangium violaceum]|uniref:hypothetical protein n=1 Tax=Archangium violaceum TaxID=83451 RepID=UPI00194FF6A2|nr:hypothetical protein [Archangium violaceum]QRN94373.1 hypothetical protein JRI60_35300 [Archangium violaceum]
MSIGSSKLPPQAAIPRPGSSVRGPQQQPQKEPARPDAGKSAPRSGGTSAKSQAKGKGDTAGGLQGHQGLTTGGSQSAREGGFDSPRDPRAFPDKAGLERLQGEAARPAPRGPELPSREAPPVAPELPQQRKTTDRESSPAGRPLPDGRAKLRALVMDRLLAGMKDAHDRLATFAQNPGRLGVANLNMVLAESAFTYAPWMEASSLPARRVGMANLLGVPQSTSDAALLRELMGEIHQGFVEFQASKPGLEARRRYDEVLQRYETMQVQPVVPGHDTGPMLAELQRLGIAHELSFTRSLILHPLLLAVGLTPDEGSDTQVMVAGLTLEELGSLVAHMRRLNPRLTNKLVRQLLLLATTDKTRGIRKGLGGSGVKDVQELARQLLRLQVTHHLVV